jgi:hypothetical protein
MGRPSTSGENVPLKLRVNFHVLESSYRKSLLNPALKAPSRKSPHKEESPVAAELAGGIES